MTMEEKWNAAHALTDLAARKLAFAIVQTEWEIEEATKRL